jgi:hypothetical protein
MRKIVDVFVTDRIVASYPVVAERLAGPTLSDEHFVELVKAQMQNSGFDSTEERAAAKFMVRGL